MRLSATRTSITAKGFVATSGYTPPVLDTTPPTLVITTNNSNLGVGDTAAITFTWSEIVTGFANDDITTTGGTLSTISGSGTTYTATFTPTASSTTNGVITVGSNVVVDTSSNANTSGDTLTMTVNTVVDTTAPTVAITTSDNSLTIGETATITFTWSETITGFADSDITTTGGTLSSISGSGLTYTATFTPTASSTADGVITVGANAVTDGSGNGNAATTLTITVNTVGTLSTVTLNYAYHAYGSDLYRSYAGYHRDRGGTITNHLKTTLVGATHSGFTDPWTNVNIDLLNDGIVSGDKIKMFVIHWKFNSGFRQDDAWDNIQFNLNGTTTDYSLFNGTTQAALWKVGRYSTYNDALAGFPNTQILNSLSTFPWFKRYGQTPSAGTGPNGSYSGSSDYMVFEGSSGLQGYFFKAVWANWVTIQ